MKRLIVLAALALAGCGSSTTTTSTATSTVTTTSTAIVTHTRTRRVSSLPPVTTTLTSTTTTTKAAPAPSAPSAPSGGHTFSGSGTESVGTINVSQDSTLHWTCSGDCTTFSVSNNPSDANDITLDSSGSGGSSAVSAGTYHQVQVISGGSWSFTISPG